LYVRNGDEWETVMPIIGNWAFTSEGYFIIPQSRTEITAVDWRWLFGELPDGEYRFQKSIMFWRSPGDFDTYVLAQSFTV
ncbi:MAG: hypothetical protein LBI27_09945, partial [Clostridiales bacterium]|jgi:hypothetical protein|nr:hypothetical protein [Clostridiales bacterium]